MLRPAGLLAVFLLQACAGLPPLEEAPERRIDAQCDTCDRSHLDAAYVIDGQRIVLVDGISDVPLLPGAASRAVTRFFGNELRHDLDGDGVADVIFFLTRETGGSGVYFYVVAALATPLGPVGSHGLLLGDRIAPQSIQGGPPGRVMVHYAERAVGQSFAAPPAVGRTLWLQFDPATRQFGKWAGDAATEP